MNPRNLLLGAAVVLAGMCILYWSVSQKPKASPPAPIAQKTTATQKLPAPAAANSGPQSTPAPVVAEKLTNRHKPVAPANIPAYQNQIDQVLRSNVGETQAAKILANILPTMPEEGQVEAAQHIANLLPDSDYQSALPILLNPNTPESVSSILFTDLMNREDSTKLNTFLQIAQVPNHPNREEALSDLQIYLDHDFGTDWAKWKSAISEYLAKQQAQ